MARRSNASRVVRAIAFITDQSSNPFDLAPVEIGTIPDFNGKQGDVVKIPLRAYFLGGVEGFSINTLPPGLTFNATYGVLEGTLSGTMAETTLTITATKGGDTAQHTFKFTVGSADAVPVLAAPSVRAALPNQSMTIDTVVNIDMRAFFDAQDATWSATGLPAALSLGAVTGALTGTLTAAQSATNFTITATNASGTIDQTATFEVTTPFVEVTPPVATGSFPDRNNTTGDVIDLSIGANFVGGAVDEYRLENGPVGLEIDSVTERIFGTITQAQMTTPTTVRAINADGEAAVTFQWTVTDPVLEGAPVLGTLAFPTQTHEVGAAINTLGTKWMFTANKDGATYSATGLPPGIVIASGNGLMTGTPTTAGSYTPQVTATNSVGPTSFTFTWTVNGTTVAAPTASGTIPDQDVQEDTTMTPLQASSYFAGAVDSYSAASLPDGVGTNSATGEISGTPTTAAAEVTVTVTATNAGGSVDQTFGFTVSASGALAAPTASGTIPAQSIAQGVPLALNVSGYFSGQNVTFTAAPLPAGFTINGLTGVFDGAASATQSATQVTVTATNSAGSATRTFDLTVTAPVVTDPIVSDLLNPYPSGPVNRVSFLGPRQINVEFEDKEGTRGVQVPYTGSGSVRGGAIYESGTVPTFSEQFNGSAVDESKWDIQVFPIFGGTYYRREHVSVSGGNLNLLLTDDAFGGVPYTGGSIRSKQTVGYGTYTCRMKAAVGSGTNSTFFMYTGPGLGTDVSEVDMEILAYAPTKMWCAIHTNDTSRPEATVSTSRHIELGFDTTAAFHTYAFEWLADGIRWYADGNLVTDSRTWGITQDKLPNLPGRFYCQLWGGIHKWTGPKGFTSTTAQFDWLTFTPADGSVAAADGGDPVGFAGGVFPPKQTNIYGDKNEPATWIWPFDTVSKTTYSDLFAITSDLTNDRSGYDKSQWTVRVNGAAKTIDRIQWRARARGVFSIAPNLVKDNALEHMGVITLTEDIPANATVEIQPTGYAAISNVYRDDIRSEAVSVCLAGFEPGTASDPCPKWATITAFEGFTRPANAAGPSGGKYTVDLASGHGSVSSVVLRDMGAEGKSNGGFSLSGTTVTIDPSKFTSSTSSTQGQTYQFISSTLGLMWCTIAVRNGQVPQVQFCREIDFTGASWKLVRVSDGATVQSGTVSLGRARTEAHSTTKSTAVNYNAAPAYIADFSTYTTPGKYRVEVAGVGCSYPFQIRQGPMQEVAEAAMRSQTMQRSGDSTRNTDAVSGGLPLRRSLHPDDGHTPKLLPSLTLADVSEGVISSSNYFVTKINAEVDADRDGDDVPLGWGGWHDAGDFDRRIQHMRIVRDTFALARICPTMQIFNMGIAESGTQRFGKVLPDFLHEALHGLDFWMRLQTALGSGGISGGIESNDIPGSGVGADTSWSESLQTYVYAPDFWSSYKFVSGACSAYRTLVAYGCDPANGNMGSLLSSIWAAWNWAEADFASSASNGKYAYRANMAPERVRAAAWLFYATGDATARAIYEAGETVSTARTETEFPDAWAYWKAAQDGRTVDATILADTVSQMTSFTNYINGGSSGGAGSFTDDGMSIMRQFVYNIGKSPTNAYVSADYFLWFYDMGILTDQDRTRALTALWHLLGSNRHNQSMMTGVGPDSYLNPLLIDSYAYGDRPVVPGLPIAAYHELRSGEADKYWTQRAKDAGIFPADYFATPMFYNAHEMMNIPPISEFVVDTNTQVAVDAACLAHEILYGNIYAGDGARVIGANTRLADTSHTWRGSRGGLFTVSGGAVTFDPSTSFWDLLASEQAITAVDLPLTAGGTQRVQVQVRGPGSAVLFDLEGQRFHWDGADRSLSDSALTDYSNGTYSLDWALGYEDGYTIVVEFEADPDTPPSENANLAAINGTGVRHAMFMQEITQDERYACRIYHLPGANFAYVYRTHADSTGQSVYGLGRQRWALTKGAASEAPISAIDHYTPQVLSGTFGAITGSPQYLDIGWDRGTGANKALPAGVSIKKLAVVKRISTATDLPDYWHGCQDQYRPVHFLGDSFLNLGRLVDAVRNDISGYVAMSEDGVGGSSLADQATRFSDAQDEYLSGSTLVIMDGGNNDTDGASAVANINLIIAQLQPGVDWIYVQPNPSTDLPIGGAQRTAWDAIQTAIQAAFPNNYLETLTHMQGGGASTAANSTRIAQGLWVEEWDEDTIHPSHISHGTADVDGYDRLAGAISAELKARKLVPA